MPADHALTIRRFYDAFAALDGDAMAACYAEDAAFDDEAFSLRGRREVGSMWKMLCGATRDKGADVWKLTYRDVQADAARGLPRASSPISTRCCSRSPPPRVSRGGLPGATTATIRRRPRPSTRCSSASSGWSATWSGGYP